jgi:hypothetical protein
VAIYFNVKAESTGAGPQLFALDNPLPNSVHDGTSLYLTSAAFIFTATYALAAVIIIEPVHLSLGIDFISRSSGQSTGSGSGDELAANHR